MGFLLGPTIFQPVLGYLPGALCTSQQWNPTGSNYQYSKGEGVSLRAEFRSLIGVPPFFATSYLDGLLQFDILQESFSRELLSYMWVILSDP